MKSLVLTLAMGEGCHCLMQLPLQMPLLLLLGVRHVKLGHALTDTGAAMRCNSLEGPEHRCWPAKDAGKIAIYEE